MLVLRYSDKKILFSVIAVIAAVVIDMEISNVYDIITNTTTSGANNTANNSFRIILFIIIVTVYGLGQYFIIGFVKQKSTAIRIKNNTIRLIHTTIAIVQVFLVAIFLLIISDIILNSYYYTGYLIGVLVISNIFTIAAIGLLSKLLFSWYKIKRDLVLMLYGAGCIASVIVAAVSIYFMGSVLLEKPSRIFDFSEAFFPSFQTGSLMNIINYVYYFGGIATFVLFWGGTTALLHHYSGKLGKVKYWVIVSTPLAFFSGQILVSIVFIPFLINSNGDNNTDFIFYYSLIFTLSSPIGGILFGVPYLIIAKKKEIVGDIVIRDYLTIAAYGLILYFISGSATVVHTPYPPFGLATISLLAISSYLILIGLYSSAVYVSSNADIRRTLHKYVTTRETTTTTTTTRGEQEPRFLSNIGLAEMEQQIERTTTSIMRKQSTEIREQTGIQLSSSNSEQEMKEYLKDVLEEMRKIKKGKVQQE